MARKIICDGCDKDISNSTVTIVRVEYSPPAGSSTIGLQPVQFDLCGSCVHHFRGSSLPQSWPRAAQVDPNPREPGSDVVPAV